jgi:hypothetical protein
MTLAQNGVGAFSLGSRGLYKEEEMKKHECCIPLFE